MSTAVVIPTEPVTLLPTPLATPPARHGLTNLGNICYLNSTIQALTRFPAFRDLFGTAAWERFKNPDRKGAELAIVTAGITQQLQRPGTATIVPAAFARSFVEFAHGINEDIRPGAQVCAAEAITILLDGLHTQLAREVTMEITGRPDRTDKQELIHSFQSWATYFRKEYSPLIGAFYGQTMTRIVCDKCAHSSLTYEPWSVLEVPIPGAEKAGGPAPTLDECIRAALNTETMEDYRCDRCKERGSVKKHHAISRYPQHLILSIKRFTNSGKKVIAQIPYDPAAIDFTSYRAWPALQTDASARYRVTAVIDHMGSLGFGHYLMRAREGDAWYTFNDEHVVPCPTGGAATPYSYVLFLDRL